MKPSERVDPSELSPEELAQLQPILDLAGRREHPFLKGSDGTEYPIPEPIFELLVRVVQDMRQGKAVLLFPEDETFTTQAAANFLGMSRQYFVTLLESGKIPFHRVGSHRRVRFKDLMAYAKIRDRDRRATLSNLFQRLRDEDYYNTEVVDGDAQ